MRRSLQLLAGLILSLAFAGIMATTLFTTLGTGDRLKEALATRMSRTTGLDVQIRGPLSVSLFPHLALTMENLRISNPGEDSSEQIQIGNAGIHINIAQLFLGRIEIKTLTARDVELFLKLSPNDPGKAAPTSPPADHTPFVGPDLWNRMSASAVFSRLHLRDVNITNATVVCMERDTTPIFFLEETDLGIQHLSQENGAGLTLRGRYRGPGHAPSVQMRMKATCRLPAPGTLLLEQLKAQAAIQDPRIPGGKLTTALSGTLTLHPLQKKIVFRAIKVRGLQSDLFTSSTLHLAPFSWEGGCILNTNPRAILRALNMSTRLPTNRQALRRLDLKTHFRAFPQHIDITDFHALMDGQTLHGDGRISHFSLPKITCRLEADQWDIAPYLSWTESQAGTSVPLPSFVKTMRLRATLTANALAWNDLTLTSVSTMIRANKGVVRIYPLKGGLAQGRINANLRADLTTHPPAMTLKTEITDLSIHEITEGTDNGTAMLGTFSSFVDLSFRGTPWAPDLSTLQGTASLTATKGTLIGVDLLGRQGRSPLTRRRNPSHTVYPFERLSAGFEADKGIVSTRNLVIESGDKVQVRAEGSYDLLTDYLQGNGRITEKNLPPVPLNISGSLRRLRTTFPSSDPAVPSPPSYPLASGATPVQAPLP